MFWLMIIVLVFAALVMLALLVIGKQLPTGWQIEKAVLVRASPAPLFDLLDDLHRWEDWSVWSAEQDAVSIEYRGADRGLGAVMLWDDGRLQGELTLTRSQAPTELHYSLRINQGKFVLAGILYLSFTDAELTQVAWRCTLQPPRYFRFSARYQIYFLRNYMETAIEESLLGLQELFEEEPSADS